MRVLLYLEPFFCKRTDGRSDKDSSGRDFWAGGPEVSYDAEKFLTENSEFKGVMVGEGEETFKELAGYYVEKIRRI
mgnify:CR=1 FL=1